MTTKTNFNELKFPIKQSEKVAISVEIEKIYHANEDMSYIQACLEFLEQHDFDIQDISKMICGTLKDKIEKEAISSRLIKSTDSENTLDNWTK